MRPVARASRATDPAKSARQRPLGNLRANLGKARAGVIDIRFLLMSVPEHPHAAMRWLHRPRPRAMMRESGANAIARAATRRYRNRNRAR
ncbi:hypothetical protein [Lysobacter antibioticus]|uniref:hypothetical protein n=1 Tax=Lysobacter antibioticus TaxID=84531 RepID=UPI00113FFC77|nr:hypothetical protein [Lysobacter antibioticus]